MEAMNVNIQTALSVRNNDAESSENSSTPFSTRQGSSQHVKNDNTMVPKPPLWTRFVKENSVTFLTECQSWIDAHLLPHWLG